MQPPSCARSPCLLVVLTSAFSLEKTTLLERCVVYLDALLSPLLSVYSTDNCFEEGDFACNLFYTEVWCSELK